MVPDFSALMTAAVGKSENGDRPNRPSIVWSGEGGSVALGHVHLNEEMAAMMRADDHDGVIATYLTRESAAIAPRLFTSAAAEALKGVIEKGIKHELDKLHASDAGRNFYLFLLLNDQHRKLARHFEDIDINRLELQLPFFDSEFIASILSIPMNICLRHRLYVKWLSLLPSAVSQTPWQSYPGHEPCPLPIAAELAYQWAGDFQTNERSSQRRRESSRAARMLREDFPRDILSTRNLKLATLVHRSGFRNYQYLLGPALTYQTYWQKCGGRYVMA
jgi:hypothetical protein